METIRVNGARLRFDTVGDAGSWIVLTPGGRRPLDDVRDLAEALSAVGFRVLLHDRRNCGYSDVVIEGDLSEQEIWAEDLAALLGELEVSPVIAGGGSAGCRLALLLAVRHPELVRGLLLWHVTGGQVAASALGEAYYGQYIELARTGGMASVCQSPFFAERIEQNPSNRARLMAQDPEHFIAVMARWRSFFHAGADLPVIGLTEEMLRRIEVPTCIIPGNDEVHRRQAAIDSSELLPSAEFHYPFDQQERASLRGQSEEVILAAHGRKLGVIYADFLQRRFRPAGDDFGSVGPDTRSVSVTATPEPED